MGASFCEVLSAGGSGPRVFSLLGSHLSAQPREPASWGQYGLTADDDSAEEDAGECVLWLLLAVVALVMLVVPVLELQQRVAALDGVGVRVLRVRWRGSLRWILQGGLLHAHHVGAVGASLPLFSRVLPMLCWVPVAPRRGEQFLTKPEKVYEPEVVGA